MYEKVNPCHPDKIADRISGAIVDLAYKNDTNPRIAVEVLIGHGKCHVIAETSTQLDVNEVNAIIERIAGNVDIDYVEVPQDIHLAENQKGTIRCGDNGIFKGVPLTIEQKKLSSIARELFDKYGSDGKYINTYARRTSKINDSDKRAEHDATYSIKEYHYMSADGKTKVKKQTYFGFRAHVLCDVLTEMPIKIVLLPANESELKTMKKILSNKLSKKQLETMEYLLLDRGYDDTKLIKLLKSKDIKPIIDIRNSWDKKSDQTKQYKDTNIVYNYKGEVFYVDDGLNLNKMTYKGYDKTRNALRYEYRGKTYRINISYDERIFTPVARDSYKWKRLYKGRTAVERFNGRLDRDYKFEDHNIRGLKKMSLLLTLSATVMLAMAKGHIQSNHQNIASLSDITGKRCDRKRRLIFKLA